jgi:hypothetical protein
MKKLISFFTIVSVLCIISCSDEFTTNEAQNVESLDTFFLEESNVEQAVIGIYDLMQLNYGVDWNSAFFLKVLPGDDANCGGPNIDDQALLQVIDDYAAVSSSNGHIESIWNLYYRTIALSNVVIENLKDSNLSNKESAVAQAKFFRAWCYFELTTMFGDIPLRTTLPTTAEDFAIAKSPQSDIYIQIESDLTDAISSLPNKSAVSDNFRISSGAAEALMGKVLVFQERYAESLPYFQSVIANAAHDLEPDVNDVWSINKEFGIESLVEIGYISTSGSTWGNLEWGGRNEGNLHVQLMGPREGVYDLTGTGLVEGWGFNVPTGKLVTAFENAGDTKRKATTLITESELIAGGGAVLSIQWDYEKAIRVKYATKAEDTSAGGDTPLNYGTNFRLFRYAEVLLLAAEAYNKVGGQDAAARTELNKIRFRAGLADVSTSLSGNDLFEAIVNEKFLELAHEGQRFWDLVRWGKASTELAGTGYTSTNDLFPIPISEIDKNTLMTIDDQNPGY